MQRQPVESEAVNSIGHQETVLEVEFSDGRVYRYFPVPESTYRDLINANSIGNFVATKIKPNFDVQNRPAREPGKAQRRLTFFCSPTSVAGWPVSVDFT